VIDECDYYILIMGGRYGSLDAEGVSFTEREYDYAVETGKVVLAFVHGDAASIPVGKSDVAPRLVQSLNEFREKVMTGRLVREWTTRENLEPMVLKAVVHATNHFPAAGWVRGDAAASEDILSQINTLRIEAEQLKEENKQLRLATAPKIEGLASLGEIVTVRYTWIDYSRSSSASREGSTQMSWSEIIKCVGPDLMSPGTTATISVSLSNHLKENRGRSSSSTIYRADLALIKNQLIALGYLRSYNAAAVNAGVTEFLELTPLGRAKLTELLAVRAAVRPPS
jgi:hypothetical protein